MKKKEKNWKSWWTSTWEVKTGAGLILVISFLYWYSIYMTTEKRKGSNIFLKWSLIDEVKAFKLPMCVMITKYKQGHKLCVSLLGKDIFGRYGPFSDVVIVNIPE